MTFLKFSRHATIVHSLWVSFFLLSTVLLSITTTEAKDHRSAFLPLNIVGRTNTTELAATVDNHLQQAFSNSDIHFIPREKATEIVDYTGTWPPKVTTLTEIADKYSLDTIAVGNLTVLGKKLSIDVKVFDTLAPEQSTFYYQTADSFAQLEEALDRISRDILRHSQKEFLIASIAPVGNKRIDSGAILQKISTKQGDIYNPTALRNDLKAIYKMGYFNDVQIDVSDTPKGKKIIFNVIEKPVIQSVIFEGIDELKEDDVKDAADIKPHFILNPSKIALARQTITQLYKTKGFYNSKVSSKITYPNDSGAVVRFTIDEGEKIYIKEISFEGNRTFDDDTLRDQMETGEKWFLSWLTESGLLDMNKIHQDAQRIVAFYNNHGFLEAKIGSPEITQKGEWLYLKFIIEEGPRFKVGTVDISGDLIDTKEKLLDLLSIRDAKFLSRQVLRDDILKLTDHYAESGYAFANIRPETRKSPDGKRIDVNFIIKKGNLVYIDRITIKGNTRTRDNVIRRELRITEGGVFNSKALRKSTQALQRLSYFEEVNITPEPAIDRDRMNVIIEVKEKSTGTFSIGAGYSSADKLIFMGTISENNFLGRGDTLALSANVSSTSSRFNLSYTNPHLNDSALSWGTDLFSTSREYDDYTKDSKGGGIRIGYPIFEKFRLYGNYSYADTDLTKVSDNASYVIRKSVNLHVTSALKFSLVRNTKNRRFAASEGSRNALSIKYAGGPLGGDSQFTKVEGSSSYYFPLFSTKIVLHLKGSFGQVFENETDKLPVYERFYLGGLNSIRGFKYGKISPIDISSNDRIGGDKMWYTNTELIFPLLEEQGVMGVVFFDAGRVYNNNENWDDNNDSIKKAAGLGLRWLSPMGPLRIVWGYNLDPLPDEKESVWDFSVGGTF